MYLYGTFNFITNTYVNFLHILIEKKSFFEVQYLFRLSVTDVEFQWTKLKEPTLVQYKPTTIDKFDCYKKQ